MHHVIMHSRVCEIEYSSDAMTELEVLPALDSWSDSTPSSLPELVDDDVDVD